MERNVTAELRNKNEHAKVSTKECTGKHNLEHMKLIFINIASKKYNLLNYKEKFATSYSCIFLKIRHTIDNGIRIHCI